MASSLRHLISDAGAAATSLVHRRIPVTQIRGFSSKVVSSPWLMLQSALKEDDDDDDMLRPALKVSGGAGMDYFNFYSLAQKKVVSFKKPSDHSPHDLLVGSSHGWLALHSNNSNSNSTGGGGGLSLLNPITGENIKLPAMVGSIPDKVILSCDPHEQECRAVASLGGPCELAFCIPGRSSKWTGITTGSMRIPPYSDLAYSTAEGLFFGVKNTLIGERGADEHEELEAWDATDPSSPKLMLSDHLYGYRYPLGRPKTPWHCNTVSYLVYDPDKLLLVRRYVCDKYHNTYGFDVYAVDRERRELVLMDRDCSSLDGLALFVGPSHSLGVRGAAGLKSGSIYYTGSLLYVTWPDRVDEACLYGHYEDPGVFDYNNIYGGNDIGVFDCKEKDKDRAIDNCYYMHDQHWDIHKIWPPPLWFTPSPSPLS